MADLKDILTKAAPALGTMIGGPLGGAVVSILAEVFGTDNDEASVEAAIKSSDPNVIAANLARAEAAFKAEAERAITIRSQIDAHVEMMRLDYSRGWWHGMWRPMAGWIATLFAAGCCFMVLWDAWHGSYLFLAQAGSVLMIGGPIMALAGIYSWGKTEERKASAMASGGAGMADVIRQALGRR